MKRKSLVIPYDGDGKLNLEAVSEYLDTISDTSKRKELIRLHGMDGSTRRAYEESIGVPPGAFELVVFLEDEGAQECFRNLSQRYLGAVQAADDEDLKRIKSEGDLAVMRFREKYPDAMRFLEYYRAIELRRRGSQMPKEATVEYCQGVIPIAVVAVSAVAVVNVFLVVNISSAANMVSLTNTFSDGE